MAAIGDASDTLNQGGKPAGYEFPDGVLQYKVTNIAPGSTVAVKITFPSGIPPGAKIFKVDASGFHEYSGAVQGDTAVIELTDGGAGDADGKVNGAVSDPVGVAVPAGSGSATIDLSAGAASAGGCSVAARSNNTGRSNPLLLFGAAFLAVRRARAVRAQCRKDRRAQG